MNRRLIAVLGCVLVVGQLVASCANIPEQTAASPILNSLAQTRSQVGLPERDADPITVVRRFIDANGDSTVARQYLTHEAEKQWRPDNQPQVIEDEFSTVPVSSGKESDPNIASVDLKGTKKGWLDSYRSFIGQTGDLSFTGTVKLVKVDGQWRISDVPGNSSIIPLSSFNNHYRPIKLYFYDPTRTVLVPDLRYLPGAPLAPAGDIVAKLLYGPATALQGAVRSALPAEAIQRTNVTQTGGVTVVNLGQLTNVTAEDKQAIAVQLVLSLQDVAAPTVRLQVEGLPLVPDRSDWKVTDVLSERDKTTPKASLAGLMAVGGRLRDLRDGKQIPGPAGDGSYKVESAAQSVDGSQLAVVEKMPTGPLQLRIGGVNEGLRQAIPQAAEMTRPTWSFGVSSDQVGREVWTVADNVVSRLVRDREGTWQNLPVNQAELERFGKITELRLSRDGVRVAVVAGGKLYVGSVNRSDAGVSIAAPKQLLPAISNVVGVDWQDASTLVVATNTPTGLVWSVRADGIEATRFSLANLTAPLTSITAAPSRQIIVTDANGMWTVSEVGQLWLPHPQQGQGPGARPFYPG